MASLGIDETDRSEAVERLGRVAIATQGVLYAVTGLLALKVAQGDGDAEASQSGAIESVARQPFGRVMLVVLVVGLVAHAGWRLVLAARGGDDPEEDTKSAVKRAANLGRAVIYLGFTAAAVRLLTSGGDGGSGGGQASEQEGTATVLTWPGGDWLVIGVGLVFIGTGLWNAKRALTSSFLEALDLSRCERTRRRAIEALGTAGYLARFAVFGLIGWFLVEAGRQHDPAEARGLDQALRELSRTSHGPVLLLVVALGMVLFGVYRMFDAVHRRASEVTHA